MDKASRTEQSVRPACAVDEIRDTLAAARSLAHQVGKLADALCGTTPCNASVGPSAEPDGIMPMLADEAHGTERAIVDARMAIDRIMRTFGI